ncbi:hypothetical protein RHMOL_Rhmol03G0113600 [Rhododendron molle]|uniref:Uncharacterized protein n=1 Tax=Rhododendron molle TaxID=49168 RepID=A0ACC0PE87_RHOML|nr:hypothetical protein RHMOL_Rhmol03G0113600 [Rhododendron molle]
MASSLDPATGVRFRRSLPRRRFCFWIWELRSWDYGSEDEVLRINEPSNARGDTDEVQQRKSQSLPKWCESEVSDNEEMNSDSVKVKRHATKRILINRAPPILTIHLKRFSQDLRGRLSKLNGHVVFGETVDLGPYLDPSQCLVNGLRLGSIAFCTRCVALEDGRVALD